jgi:uncharacterized protein YabE (DUF348 family)
MAYLALIASTVLQPVQRFSRRSFGLLVDARLSRRLLGGLLALAAWGILALGYRITGVPVTLVVDGQPQYLRTHQETVQGLLREMNVPLQPEDTVAPAGDRELAAGSVVQVRLARPVSIEADGRGVSLLTQRRRVSDVLAEAAVRVNLRDEVLVDGQAWDLDAELPKPSLDGARADPLRIVLRRAVPVILTDHEVPVTFYTTKATVGEALLAQGILLYLGDRVTPSLGSRLLPGMRIFVERSTPITIQTQRRILRTRTRQQTVGDALAQEGILLMGMDYSRPAPDVPITDDMAIRVVRVRETQEIEQELIPFETKWVAEAAMMIDRQEVIQPGGVGVIKRRSRVTYEDGQAVANVMEDEWLDRSPSERIIAYGTQIAVFTLDTPDGPFEYWRHFQVLATSYSAATAGVSPDTPHYGITRTGLKAGYGVIAVDPQVISLWAEVYVPGYGRAVAGDTGGSIRGRHIDLGFNEDAPPLWYRWVDVYLATPVPPADQIRYVLPNWPQAPR